MKILFPEQKFTPTLQLFKHMGNRPGTAFMLIIALIWTVWLVEGIKPHRVSASGQPETWAKTIVDSGEQSGVAISPAALTSDLALLAIKAMVKEFPGISPLRILSITSPVNGITAVAIQPPYREFPNVVLFRYDEDAKGWKRIPEALCLGIQSKVSKILDLHTAGHAADILQLDSAEDRRKMSDMAANSGMVVVSYQRFAHLHAGGGELYYLDKQDFPRLARQLMVITKKVDPDNCTLFDMPDILGVSFSHDSGRFKLTARTSNNQEWTVSFAGIDQRGQLDQKSISAGTIDAKSLRAK
jgi:hypothetical protein